MVPERVTRKQQDSSQPPAAGLAQAKAESLAQFIAIAGAVDIAVAQCIVDAAAEGVHRVRTGSRRLQARLEAMLREGGVAATDLQQPARAWLRVLKQIRRAAGPVRDLDVHRELLASWLSKRATLVAGSQLSDAALQAQAASLDGWLTLQRARQAVIMQKRIGRRVKRLAERQGLLLATMQQATMQRAAGERRRVPRPADLVALDDFVRAADAMPALYSENLHDFRKATKKARYVAEAGGKKASDVGNALKRIQDSIGDWHDWLCLAQEANTALGDEGVALLALFEQEVDRHFAAAMRATERARGQLLGEWMATQAGRVVRRPRRRGPAVGA